MPAGLSAFTGNSYLFVVVFFFQSQLRYCPKLLEISYLKCSELSPRHASFSLMFTVVQHFAPTRLETYGLRVPSRNLRDFTWFKVDFKFRNCPSARCASVSTAVSRDSIFDGGSVLLNDFLDVDIFTKQIRTFARDYTDVCGFWF
jgi:hypothetical protein